MHRLRIGIVVPHIFMHELVMPHVIFSPGNLAIDLAENLQALGHDITLFTPGPVSTSVKNKTANLDLFQKELDVRGDTYMDLLKKHPFTFVTLARQVQSEIIARAYKMANDGEFDLVHIYMNEEDNALPFASLCSKPVVFSHHDPFNFLVKYKSCFPKYPNLNWISFSFAQRDGMPKKTNWVGNIYHGLPENEFTPSYENPQNYIVYLGRIIESKGVHLAIRAVRKYNKYAKEKITLKIAGKHYSGNKKDSYWQEKIEPELKDPNIEFVGFIKSSSAKQEILEKARALIIPSIFDEPFGMVMIEALACATPIIGINSGAIPEIVNKKIGILVNKSNEEKMITDLSKAFNDISGIKRQDCRIEFVQKYTSTRMANEYLEVYKSLIKE